MEFPVTADQVQPAAKPVPEHISDERLAEVRRLASVEENDCLRDGARSAAQYHADVGSALTELRHRREAEAGAIERCAKVADAYSDIWKRGRNPEDAPEARVGAGREIAEAIRALAAAPSSPASGVRVKALEAALLEMQQAAGLAIEALPADQQDGTVGTFLATIHRHCASALSLGHGGDLEPLSALGEHP